MTLSIKAYNKEYKSAINDLISDDDFVSADMMTCLDNFPQFGQIVEGESGILAVGVFTGARKKTSMSLYVKPSRRKEGIGRMLIESLEEAMRAVDVEEVVCDFKVNELEKSFLYANGYKKWFCSNYMTYTGDNQTTHNHDIINYDDSYYEACQKVFSEPFHRMRLSVGLESTLSLPSEEERSTYKENSENIFLLREHNQIVAAVKLDGDEIDALATGIEYQGKGYGKALIHFSVDKILERGFEKVHLWVVEGNSAKSLYEKSGFVKERMHEFVVKRIM